MRNCPVSYEKRVSILFLALANGINVGFQFSDPELMDGTWDSYSFLTNGMYSRLDYEVYKCNLYLDNTNEAQAQRRAEARFLRAMMWWYMLDMYGSVPIALSSDQGNRSNYYGNAIQRPAQKSRGEI